MTDLFPLHEIVDQAERDSWAPINLNDLPETPPIQPQLGETSLVYPGKRHVFSGPPESAKTLAAYCVLIQIVRLGGKAILIDFEMGAYDARQRLRELGATADEINRIAYIEPDERITRERIALLVATKPDLVVIDATAGVYSLEGLDDNKRGDVEKVSALYVKVFWRHSIATILIDHVVKDGEARGRYAIGSERKLGGADVHLGFDTVKPISRGTAGQYKIVTHKDRGGYLKRGHLADLALDSNPDTHNITWTFTEPVTSTDDEGNFRFTKLMQKISRELSGVTEPLSKAEVKRRVGGNSSQLGKAIETMVDEGYLTASEGAHSAVNVLLTRAYTEAQDPRLNPVDNPSTPPVPVLFSSCSETGTQVTCSPVPPPTGGTGREQLSSPAENNSPVPDTTGWFNNDGHLIDSELAWLDELTPDHDPDADPNP